MTKVENDRDTLKQFRDWLEGAMQLSGREASGRDDLRNCLYRQSCRYSPCERVRLAIVERTILMVTNDPSLLDETSVENGMFHVLHRVAITELNVSVSSNDLTPVSPHIEPENFARSEHELMPLPVLSGRRVLLVEDEYLVAINLQKLLENAGATVLGPIPDVDQTIELLEEDSLVLDGAVLDINLRGEMVYPAAIILSRRGTPFIFVTGYDCKKHPCRVPSEPLHHETLRRC